MMAEVVFAVPILAGREQLDRETFEELEGARRDEYEAALGEAGIRRHAVWHQETPNGMLAVVYMEADDEASVSKFAGSDAPLNSWFREQMKVVHGIDISQPAPPPTKVHDVTA
jgi:L-rhamnose mutarotase